MITPGQTPHSPRPWKVEWGALVTAADGSIVFDMCGIDFHCDEANAALIVEAVNTRAELQAVLHTTRMDREKSEAQLTEAIALIRDSWDMTAGQWIHVREKFLADFDKQATP